jgi:uncharacterized membrane protein
MTGSAETRTMKMEKNRLESLTDGIFAFAMTLLVASMILPRSTVVTETSGAALISLIPDFFHYIIAFFVLAAFWMAHHSQFSRIRFVDKNFLFLSIIGLFFTTLVPFSTSFIGDYSEDAPSTIVFELNLLILGLVFALQWYYASRNYYLISPEYPASQVLRTLKHSLIIPFISFLGILITLAGFNSSTLVYLMSPVVTYMVERSSRRDTGDEAGIREE